MTGAIDGLLPACAAATMFAHFQRHDDMPRQLRFGHAALRQSAGAKYGSQLPFADITEHFDDAFQRQPALFSQDTRIITIGFTGAPRSGWHQARDARMMREGCQAKGIAASWNTIGLNKASMKRCDGRMLTGCMAAPR